MKWLILTFLFAAFWWALFYHSFNRDRSRYRNCYLLFIAIISGIPFLVNVPGPYGLLASLVLVYGTFFGLLAVPYFLMHNGFTMMKKEGRQLPHMLSLVLGIVILLGETAIIYNIITDVTEFNSPSYTPGLTTHSILYYFLLLFGITIIYGSMSILIFTIYIIMMQIIPWRKDFDYVVILGAGLIDGERVSKLLSDRIDKAIEVYNKAGRRPKLIPSGGQGDDEKISEAQAMKNYLLMKGIPEDDIILEDKSATTFENLTNSKRIIESRDGRKNTALVSSNYHVYRALRYCRKLDFKCSGIGGHTAFYYWPCALLREYIAVHAEKKHAVIFILGWLMCMGLTIAYIVVNTKHLL